MEGKSMNVSGASSKTQLYKELKDLGLTNKFVRKFLPEWWDDSLLKTKSGVLQFALILKQRLGLDYALNCESDSSLHITFKQADSLVQFKKRKTVDDKRIQQASFYCQSVVRTVLRLQEKNEMHQRISNIIRVVTNGSFNLELKNVLEECWANGLPVLFVDNLPKNIPRPAGMVMKWGDRFGIALAHRHKNDMVQLFVLLHEIGHISLGHVGKDKVIFDESHGITDGTIREEGDAQEIEADEFALEVLRKGTDLPKLVSQQGYFTNPAELMLFGHHIEKEYAVPAGHVILTYARERNEWALAQKAMNFLPSNDAVKTIQSVGCGYLRKMDMSGDDLEFLSEVARVKV